MRKHRIINPGSRLLAMVMAVMLAVPTSSLTVYAEDGSANSEPILEQEVQLISEITVNEPAEGLYVRQSRKNKNTGEYEVLGENRISGETMQLIFPVMICIRII